MDVHLCKGEVYSFSFFGKAESCENSTSSLDKQQCHECCKNHYKQNESIQNNKIKSSGCCSNKQIALKLSSDLEQIEKSVCTDREFFVAAKIIQILFCSVNGFDAAKTHWIEPPPRATEDLSILYQVFRI